MTTNFSVTSGVTILGGTQFSNSAGPGPGPGPAVAGVDNAVGFLQFNPFNPQGGPVPDWIHDQTATINGDTGITINNWTTAGMSMLNLTTSNMTWFLANFGAVSSANPVPCTITWGPGSTVASSQGNILQVDNGYFKMISFRWNQPMGTVATYNYPYVFSKP